VTRAELEQLAVGELGEGATVRTEHCNACRREHLAVVWQHPEFGRETIGAHMASEERELLALAAVVRAIARGSMEWDESAL